MSFGGVCKKNSSPLSGSSLLLVWNCRLSWRIELQPDGHVAYGAYGSGLLEDVHFLVFGAVAAVANFHGSLP